jgi:hypothetical protein
MSARVVVVIFVQQQNVAQMPFADDYDMVDAFPPVKFALSRASI